VPPPRPPQPNPLVLAALRGGVADGVGAAVTASAGGGGAAAAGVGAAGGADGGGGGDAAVQRGPLERPPWPFEGGESTTRALLVGPDGIQPWDDEAAGAAAGRRGSRRDSYGGRSANSNSPSSSARRTQSSGNSAAPPTTAGTPDRAALEAAAIEHLREHGARAAAAFRDGPPQRHLREVTIRRLAGVPLGLRLKVDPQRSSSGPGGTGAVVVVREKASIPCATTHHVDAFKCV
jgi:hypothetical protein